MIAFFFLIMFIGIALRFGLVGVFDEIKSHFINVGDPRLDTVSVIQAS
jgi:hypothetical protein